MLATLEMIIMNEVSGKIVFSKTRAGANIASHSLWHTCVVVIISISHSNIRMDTHTHFIISPVAAYVNVGRLREQHT